MQPSSGEAYNTLSQSVADGTLHMDLREKRGVGVGPDFNYKLPNGFGQGTFKYYYVHDENPGVYINLAPIEEWWTHVAVHDQSHTAVLVVRGGGRGRGGGMGGGRDT